MSAYAGYGQSSGGSAYAGYNGQTSTAAGPPAAKKGAGGFLGTLEHVVTQTPADLFHAAVDSPGAIAKLVTDAAHSHWLTGGPSWHDLGQEWLHPLRPVKNDALSGDIQGMARSYGETLQHPLRNPGLTLLDVAPVVGKVASGALRAGAATKALSAGEGSAALKALVTKPSLGPRTLTQDGVTLATGHYSRAPGSALVQKGVDALLEKGKPGSAIENRLHGRAAKWNERNLRVAEATARAPGTRLQALGARLKPEEQRALRLVAEEVPVARRLGAQHMRAGRSTTEQETLRHQERIALTEGAAQFLDEGPGGKPVFKPAAAKLATVYDALVHASADRGDMLKNLDLMDAAAQQAAKTKSSRLAAGGTFTKEGVVGAEDITPSAGSPYVGYPVERTKLLGRPKVSSTGTFGHTRKLSSLKQSTGWSVEHGLERNDVTNIVGERHVEAVRLSSIQRRVDLAKKAGKAAPTRKDDVFMWTDKTVSSERIPSDVRRYLDNPDEFGRLPHGEQQSVLDKLRAAAFDRHNWVADAAARAQFEELAAKGKGMFVPRRFLGDVGKRHVSIEGVPGVKFIDSVNNAQKAALIYLKVNYPVVQGLSNVAMGLVQQGFAYPLNITKAVRLSQAVGPEYAAIVDDIMGQGAVMQAAFHGEGAVSHVSQKIAGVMTRKVDQPARRAAFLHEADKAGYGSPEKLRALIDDDANVADLAQVAQRGKEAIVDYGELGPTERSLIRRLLFVYPWTKGATKYAGHFVRDHPVQAAALGLLGQKGKQLSDQNLGPVPSYLDGVFGVGGGLVNPNSLNPLQTPAQVGQAIAGYLTGNPAAPTGQNFLAPAAATLTALLTKRNDIGQPLKGNLLQNLRQTLVEPAPIASGARSLVAGHTSGGADLVRMIAGSHSQSKTFPDSADALWRFLFGGLYPRQFDKGALNKNAALEKTGR